MLWFLIDKRGLGLMHAVDAYRTTDRLLEVHRTSLMVRRRWEVKGLSS